MAVVACSSATIVAWTYFAAVNPTIGAAAVAGVASIVNTLILLWHDRRVDRRLTERRLVVTKGADAVTIADEDRRELEDRRARPETRKLRERRRRRRRNEPL